MTGQWLGSQTDLMRHEYVRYFDTVRTVATYLILSCILAGERGELPALCIFGHCGERTILAL